MSSHYSSAPDGKDGFRFVQVEPDKLGRPALREPEEAGAPSRRRAHIKSRHGCSACKKRKVKCDEGRPSCQNCIKRREACSLTYDATHASRNREPASPSRGLVSPDVNFLHMRLLYHFNEFTASTLIFEEQVWRKKVVPLAFQHDFLMHAILLTSSSHLSHLNPSMAIYHRASMLHLQRTLHLFRNALTQPTTHSNANALMATAALLVHYAWASTDEVLPSSSPERDQSQSGNTSSLPLRLGSDPLFCLARGLREVFATAFNFVGLGNTIFTSSILHGQCPAHITGKNEPTAEEVVAKLAGKDLHAEDSVYRSPSITGSESSTTAPRDFSDFNDLPNRLALVYMLFQQFPLRYLHADRTGDTSECHDYSRADIVRSMFYFPTCASEEYLTLVRQDNSCALLLMFFYYRVVDSILPGSQYWWSRKRSEILAPVIERHLRSKGDPNIEAVLEEGNKMLQDELRGVQTPSDILTERLGGNGSLQRSRSLLAELGWHGIFAQTYVDE